MPTPYEAERLRILEMIENGTISAEDGVRLLESLTPSDPPPSPEAPPEEPPDQLPPELEPEFEVLESAPPTSIPPEIAKRRGWWKYPFWAGVLLAILGSALMFAALETSGIGLWVVCGSLPFFIGLGIMVFSWYSRTATWLHLRIRQEPGEWPAQINLSFPLPIHLAAGFIRVFGRWIPNMDHTGVDEVLLALSENATPDHPLYVEVEDDEDGEKVEIYIG